MEERIIKFRCFYRGVKHFVGEMDFYPDGSFGPTILVNDDGYRFSSDSEHVKGLGQFTGLKDKNGKEIYEGDILRWPSSEPYQDINYTIYEVFFHDGNESESNVGFQFNRLHYKGAIAGGITYRFIPRTTLKMIVIGNIYENPELITP